MREELQRANSELEHKLDSERQLTARMSSVQRQTAQTLSVRPIGCAGGGDCGPYGL